MRERTELMIRGMSEARTKRGRWLALVTALAFLTGGNVFWELREIGTAITEDDMCTLEAHEHTESCYDENGTLICGREEHIHTAACFSDENADLETEEVWELTLPERDGIPRQELMALIAESQLGYTESENNFIRSEDGTQQGYSRYGAWYGSPYGEWNTMFAYFCLYYAGVSTEEIPCGGNARAWQVKLTESGLIRGLDSEPERGEIILLDLDADGAADRAGIITDTDERLTVIEGDCGDMVAETLYAPDAEQILGYVTIPAGDTPAEEITAGEDPQAAEEAPPEETAAETAEEPGAGSGTERDPEPDEPLVTYKAESGSGIQVNASAPTDAFPVEVTLRVTDISREEALRTAAENLETDAETLDAVAVDISFIDAAGTELEPAGGVDVEIRLPETQQLAGEAFTLLHRADDGEVETVDAEIAGDVVTFTSDAFSMYILTSNGDYRDVSQTFTVDGHTFPNSAATPYVIHVGESFTLRSETDTTLGDGHGNQWFASQSVDGVLSRTYLFGGKNYKDEIINGNSYRVCEAKYTGDLIGTADIAVEKKPSGNEHFYVNVLGRNQQYFVWPGNAPVAASDLTFNGQSSPNSPDNPYIVYVGDTFSVFLSETGTSGQAGYSQGYFTLPNNNQAGKTILSVEGNPDYINFTYDATSVAGCKRTFKAETPGNVTCRTYYDNGVTNQNIQEFYIKVIDPYGNANNKIRVKTEYEDKPIDKVKEYLAGYNLENDGVGYVPNGVGQYGNHSSPRPYAVRHDDTFVIYVDGNVAQSAVTFDNYDQWFDSSKNYSCVLKVSDQQKLTILEREYDQENNRTKIRFKPVENVGDSVVNIKFSDCSMWVRVLPPQTFNHADMEIADGGKYTITSTSIEDGQLRTTIKVYDAYVSYVNSAVLRDDSGNPLALKPTWTDYPAEYMFSSSTNNPAGKSDYGLKEGTTQHEYTSAPGFGGRPKDYQADDVKTVDFDVNIELIPEKQCVIPIDPNATWVWTPLTEERPPLTDVVWHFDQQGILDAMNKCPMTNGLDFTIRSNAAIVDLKAVKELNGGDLEAGQFTFQLYDETNQPVGGTVTNNADGNIVFLDQMYEETGTYKYTIREVIPENDNAQLIYAADQEITVVVTEIEVPIDGGGTIKALKAEMDGDPPTLTNYVTYRLPDTGGSGTLPWYLGGIVLLAASVLLLMKKRREDA